MPLDHTSFSKAIERLDDALAMPAAYPSNDVVRDGVIQAVRLHLRIRS